MTYLNTIENEYSEMQKQINELRSQMQEKSKELMKEAFREFFEKYEEPVECIFWAQYTPYFNDGDACEFRVNEINILLKDDEDACDYEGSSLYDLDNIEELKANIQKWEAWEKDPIGEARKYQSDYIKRYNRNPFDQNSWHRKTEQQQMEEWRPYYTSKERLQEQLEFAENFQWPNLKSDFEKIKQLISNIDEDLMLAMFGDHCKVIVAKDSIEVEEYSHD